MTGKAYTMKEMKAIVNYLVEHKAFSEIRGRKMWMDFASSKDTTRTWQSLKETFLKRILPDIHNPYYKLSLVEIASFKQGLDIESKLDHKLDVEPVNNQPIPGTSKENGHNGEQAEDGDKKQENKENGEEQSGEGHVKISENLNNIRDSTETLVLEPCYHTADDIRKDLENDNEQNKATPKDDQKQNDLLEQDPAADCENNDKINDVINNTVEEQNQLPIEISDSEEKQPESKNIDNETGTKEHDQTMDNNNPKNTSNSILTSNDADQSKNLVENKENLDKSKNTTQSSSSTTIDTQLPNNPEELKVSEKIETAKKLNKLSLDRKRSNRATSETVPTKRKKIQQKSVSDTDAVKNCKIEEKQAEVTNCETQQEKSDVSKALNMDVDKEITHSENLKENPENQIEVSHNAQVTSNEVVDANDENSQCGQIQVTPEIENPCLKSVNLYEEQFSCTIYSDSDDQPGEKNKKDPPKKNEAIPQWPKENIQVIRSSSTDVPNKSNLRIVEKKLRENALARAIGFSSNGPRNRKRSVSYNKRRPSSHKKIEISSDSSSSSYDTESDFVSPPRGNHKRHRKYLKPESHKILSLGEEGTLFVMNGRKIYPVIKNGRALKTYVNYSSDGQSDNEESYWKLKYVEERKKATELAKQLENFTKTLAKESSVVPVEKTTNVDVPKEIAKPQGMDETCSKSIPVSKATDEKSIKIKITNNEKEVQVEGPWSCINPVLEQVVQMMKDTEQVPVTKARSSSLELIALSGVSSPAENSAKRVAEMEKEIFKEIEEIDKAEKEVPEIQKETENEAETTTRKRTRKGNVSVSKVASSTKKAKVDETKTDNSKVLTRRTRTPRKVKDDTNDTPLTANITNKRNSDKSENQEQDEDILYKFPSPPRESNRTKRAPPRPRYTLKTARIYSSPDHLSLHSEETQGYIDTDCSPVICLRRKRKTSIVSRRLSRYRKKSIPSITEDLSSESSLVAAPIQTQTFINSSLSSQIYRSDSYQLLMPKAKVSSNYLEKIEEFSMNSNEDELPGKNGFGAEDNFDNPNNFNDKDQSCDLSLPTSPVLSIVENFSVNKSLLSNLDENDECEPITLNNLMPAVDVSMPLMESNYEVKKKSEDGTQFHYNLRDRSMSDSLVNKVSTVQIDDVPNSISTKLRNLVIESAKKDAAKVKLVEVLKEPIIAEKPKADNKKAKAKKRSSTPRKRQSTRSLKSPLSEPCIEEHTETCSRAVNRSQPPIIKITYADSEPPQNIETKKVTRGRRKPKKDIIKVKLPKVVSRRKTDIASKSTEDMGVSNDTESGIFLQGFNDSVELIHNHSDSCCKAHECINDSLEIIEPSQKSIITIESDSGPNVEYNSVMDKNVAFEMINQNAQDGTDLIAALAKIRSSSEISNSLLTDDLSEEITTPRSSKWYLLSEEENSTTLQEKNSQYNSYGANLNEIFPITCAVPNLSTISEASKDIDENSRNDANRKLFNF